MCVLRKYPQEVAHYIRDLSVGPVADFEDPTLGEKLETLVRGCIYLRDFRFVWAR